MKRIYSATASMLSIVLLTLMLSACSTTSDKFKLTVAHLNDTHSHVEASPVVLNINGARTVVEFGGMARLKTAVDELRNRPKSNFMLFHSGDAVQGTLYFNIFKGILDFELLNMLGVDAMTFGNHEFDRGPVAIPQYLVRTRFPMLSANIDFSGEPAIVNMVSPFVIRHVDGEMIGLLGVTTETTPLSTLNVGKTKFNDNIESVRKTVNELTSKGVNKIIVLSHLGYAADKKLAAEVEGIDVIVGGHTHTLLGDASVLNRVGLAPEGPYPTVVMSPAGKKVLVLQAWKWGFILGAMDINFTKTGEIAGYADQSKWIMGDRFSRNGVVVEVGSSAYKDIAATLKKSINARTVAEDRQMAAFILPYTSKLSAYRNKIVARADADIIQGQNSGPGPLVADSMLAAVPSARIALLNYGGVRRNLAAGKISAGDLMEVLPFGGTLNIVDLSGAELKTALEEGIGFQLKKFSGAKPLPMPYVAGVRYTVNTAGLFGKMVLSLEVKDDKGAYHPVQASTVYRCVVNKFVAGGGDGFSTIKNASRFRSDTGIIDSDALISFLTKKGSVSNPNEVRVVILPVDAEADNYGIQSGGVKASAQ